jgi:phospholipid-translocating ATPase
VTEAYFPADRDIIREAWVVGDLKDRLGIKHRKRSKATTLGPEDASLFRPHLRTTSENSSSDQDRGEYQPVASPSSSPRPIGNSSELDLPTSSRRQPTAMSYYSASDIPVSNTPIPPSRPQLTLHPSSAEQRRPERSMASPSSPSRPGPSSPTSPVMAVPNTAASNRTSGTGHLAPGEYEMALRPSLHSPEPSSASRISQASFVTASDGGWEAENDDGATVRHHH